MNERVNNQEAQAEKDNNQNITKIQEKNVCVFVCFVFFVIL